MRVTYWQTHYSERIADHVKWRTLSNVPHIRRSCSNFSLDYSAKMCFVGNLGTFQRSKWFSGQQICNNSLPHYKAGQAEINPTSSTFLKNEHTKNADPVSQRSRLITPVPPEHGALFKTQIRCVCQIRSQEGLRDHSAAESGEGG